MDSLLKNAVSNVTSNLTHSDNNDNQQHNHNDQNGGNNGNPLMGFVNNALGGGQSSEAKEDFIDKAVDYAQEKFLNAGPQDNESAMEQAKDEMIGNAIRDGLKQVTGKDFTKH